MSLLKNLTTDDTIANERDSVGGFSVLESDLYPAKIELAYLAPSEGGALSLVIHAKTDQGQDIRSTQWMTSGTAKGCKNFYIDKNGDKQYLPGFIMANALALLTTGKEISELDPEIKVINKYSKEAGAEVPTKVEMLTELVGQEINIGLIKQIVDKTEKNPAYDPSQPKSDKNLQYIPTGETREENEVDKFFRASDNKTTAEIRGQADEAKFFETWVGKWKGKLRDKSTKDAKGNAGAPGAPKRAAAPGGSAKPTASLFAS